MVFLPEVIHNILEAKTTKEVWEKLEGPLYKKEYNEQVICEEATYNLHIMRIQICWASQQVQHVKHSIVKFWGELWEGKSEMVVFVVSAKWRVNCKLHP